MSSYQEIVSKIQALQQQAEALKATEQAAAIAGIREKIQEFSLTAEDLGFGGRVPAGKKVAATAGRKLPVRYRDGEGNTWTGRGKRPGWLTAALASGKDLQDFAVG